MENTLLNLIPAAYLPEIHLSQYDVGRTITFTLKDGASDYSVPSGASVKVKATKPSGFGFEVACTFNGGTVTLVTTDTMTPENGRFPAELSIVSGNTTIGTSNFIFNIERSPHPEGTIDGDAESLLPELTLLVERIEDAASRVLDMQVVANTLPSGSQATYSYDEELNKATFGIPQGEPGAGAVGTVASAYDASKTYAVGDYAIHNNDLYRCITAITTAEAFTASHWTKIVLADDVTDLKSDLNEVNNFEQYVFQYLNQATRANGFLWNTSGNGVVKVGGFDVNTYVAYDPIKLKAGTYHFNGIIFGGQSYMVVNDEITVLTDFNNHLSPNNHYQFTLENDCTLYLSASFQRVPNGLALYNHLDGFYSDSVQYGILTSKDRLDIADNEDRIESLESTVDFDYSAFDQFYIKNKELICSNSKNHVGIVAKYAIVDVGGDLIKVMARTKIKGGSLGLIASNHKERKLIETITTGSLHFIFDYYKVEVGIYIANGNQHNLCTICTTGMTTDGVAEYQMGYEFMGNDTIRFYLAQPLRATDPIIIIDSDCAVVQVNSTTVDVTYAGFDNYNGQYLVVEEYQGSATADSELLIPHVTGLYAKANNVPSFRDNFNRQNGVLNVAPTGHIYTLFSSVDNSDTIYDSNSVL